MFIPIWPWNTLPSIFKESMFVSLIGTFSYLHIYVCSVYMYPRTVHEIYRVCNICDVSIILCMTGAGGPEPPKKLLPSSDYLYNMTARNVSDWLVKTMERYQKRRLVTKTTLRSVLRQVLRIIIVLYKLTVWTVVITVHVLTELQLYWLSYWYLQIKVPLNLVYCHECWCKGFYVYGLLYIKCISNL